MISITLLVITLVLTLQSMLTLVWMLYAWEDPKYIKSRRSPQTFVEPKYTFTALLAARHEEKVISDTIKAIDAIDYPNHLKELLILIRQDDTKTLSKAFSIVKELGKDNIRLITFLDYPINKPHSLNIGLAEAHGEIIAIFDAEDEPHQDIYQIINTVISQEKVDVVQSGVQLMNYRDHWFSAFNVMEYFFWFMSGLHFFSRIGKATPLGGNTVFFKRIYLRTIGGWDEHCLTEDADIGIRLSQLGARIKVIYDHKHVTHEETPSSALEFIKQRTRWHHGFLQILFKGDWAKQPLLRQRLMLFYILVSPIVQAILIIYLPFSIFIAITTKLSIVITLLSFLPSYLLCLQFAVTNIGLWEFTRAYRLKYPFWLPVKLAITYIPYQILLFVSACRAIYRLSVQENAWEKTLHTNAHRQAVMPQS